MVLDHANYTASEVAFRKSANFDPDFILVKPLVARISTDPAERAAIFKTLEGVQPPTADEQKLFAVFMELAQLMIYRDQKKDDLLKMQVERAFRIGEENLKYIAEKYPDELFYISEYIEVMHRNHGASLARLTAFELVPPEKQREALFLWGYTAMLSAEMGHFKKARKQARVLEKQFRDIEAPRPWVVWADILLKQGKRKKALEYVEKALAIDPGCIDAQRLKAELEE